MYQILSQVKKEFLTTSKVFFKRTFSQVEAGKEDKIAE